MKYFYFCFSFTSRIIFCRIYLLICPISISVVLISLIDGLQSKFILRFFECNIRFLHRDKTEIFFLYLKDYFLWDMFADLSDIDLNCVNQLTVKIYIKIFECIVRFFNRDKVEISFLLRGLFSQGYYIFSHLFYINLISVDWLLKFSYDP